MPVKTELASRAGSISYLISCCFFGLLQPSKVASDRELFKFVFNPVVCWFEPTLESRAPRAADFDLFRGLICPGL